MLVPFVVVVLLQLQTNHRYNDADKEHENRKLVIRMSEPEHRHTLEDQATPEEH